MPTKVQLQEQLIELQDNFDDARRDARAANEKYDRSQSRCGDLQSDVSRLEKQVGWYEREREENQRYYDEALRLLQPHLAPYDYTGGAGPQPEDPMDRLLLQMRERLSRYYSTSDDLLYRNLASRHFERAY